MPDYADRLRILVEQAVPRLLSMPASAHGRRPSDGKWSPREIIGHLIDSVSNNHQRFVRAQFQDDLVFPGYDQDRWVAAQRYHDAPWTELVVLWRAFNLHLARVMESVPDAERLRPRQTHNLDQIAFSPVPRSEPATLDYFMADYVAHLEHHLRQVGATPFATPEEAATVGTSKYATVLASASDGRNAIVIINGGTDTYFYPYGIELRFDGVGWVELRSGNGWGDALSAGWAITEEAADGTRTGMWHFSGPVPANVDRARVVRGSERREVAVQNGMLLAVFFSCSDDGNEPWLEAVRQNGEWRDAPGLAASHP